MSSTNNDCYGNLFPDLDQLARNTPASGKAFRAIVRSFGIGVAERRVEVIEDEWKKCVACPRYRDCCDLSMAKLALREALPAW
jgi:hypothetical protein